MQILWNSKANITSHRVFHDTKHKFKRLHEAWCMLQELKQDRSRKGITFQWRRRLWWGHAGRLRLLKPRNWRRRV